MEMTVYELIQLLEKCENPNAKVYFRLDIEEDTIKELADDNSYLKNEPLYFSEIEFDDDQLDINLYY